jgi:hypothetical protein
MQHPIGRSGNVRNRRRDEILPHIASAKLAGDQTREFHIDACQYAIAVGVEWLTGNSADVAMIDFSGGEHAELRRDRVIQTAVSPVDLAVAVVDVDRRAIRGHRRAVVVGIDPHAERSGQAIDFLADGDVAGQERIRRRLHGAEGRAQRADLLMQIRGLETGQDLEIVLDVDPTAPLDIGIGLVKARVLTIEDRFCAGLDIQAMSLP